ncbi:MAG: ROK family protein [Eubacteriales bacterium]
MTDTGMTTMEVKKHNKNTVYNLIYRERSTCKLIITQKLQMGLSTVNQNLKLLEEEGLIQKNGFFESTGGRKADAIEIIPTVKISLGAAILKDMIDIVATDLYGSILCSCTYSLTYKHDFAYYQQFSDYVHSFIQSNQLSTVDILGLSIATQGIISSEGNSVIYGKILDNQAMSLQDLQPYFNFPCKLEHDSKAAANLELWKHQELSDAIILLLNRNMGGAIITDGTVHKGTNMHSGLIEHLSLNNDGALCYCGKRGCLETYCSADALAHVAGMDIPQFFNQLRNSGTTCQAIWDEYLGYLAFAIRNLSIIVNGKVIISGYLAPYFQEEDLNTLLRKINSISTFPLNRGDIIVGTTGQFTQAVGASLHYIKEFLVQV